MRKVKDIDEYISGFPLDIQKVLSQVRKFVREEAPEAEETISYAIPAYMLNKTYLIYFAGYKNHYSIYPVPKGSETFQKEISAHKTGKGTLQFAYDKPVPAVLISKIVKHSLKENRERVKLK